MAPERFRRVAVAIDASAGAGEALDVAIDLARAFHASLRIIAVAPLPPVFATPNPPIAPAAFPDDAGPRYRQLADTAVGRARAAGVADVEAATPEGVVVDEVLAQVRADGTDLLVVGSRGLSTVQRLMLGSVSSGLVTHAPCPVLVVRESKRPPA